MKLNKKIKFLILVTALVVSGAFVYMQVSAGVLFGKTPVSLTDGLVGHWTFDGPDMINNVADSSGQGNTGYLNGQTATTTVIGKMGQALEFDGVDDYVDVGGIGDMGNIFTISAWVKPDTAPQGDSYAVIATNGFPGSNRDYKVILQDDGTGKFRVNIGNGTTFASASDTISYVANTWYFVVGTFDGATLRYYRDGIEISTTSSSLTTFTTSAFRVGNGRSNDTTEENYFDGTIDDVRIYNRALSAGEVAQLYTQTAGNKVNKTRSGVTDNFSSNLVAQWTFDGVDMDWATTTPATDKTSNNNDAKVAHGTAVATGKTGQALQFRGASDFVTASSTPSLEIADDLTISAWMKPEGGGTATSSGDIGSAVLDSFEFDTTMGTTPNISKISGNVYAVAYQGPASDGFIKTIAINDNGSIDGTIDSWEYDTLNGQAPNIINVVGDIYAMAYSGDATDGWLMTFKINPDGTIVKSAIDTLEFDISRAVNPKIIHVSENVYAIAYEGLGDDAWLVTVTIDSNGTISNAVVDSLEVDAVDGEFPFIAHVSGDIYAISHSEASIADRVTLKTVSINSAGQIGATAIDTFVLNDDTSGLTKTSSIVHISGDVYAIFYEGEASDGFVKTVTIGTDGQIGATAIDTLEFDISNGTFQSVVYVSKNVYAVSYEGSSSDGWLKTITIDDDGVIGNSVVDSLEFDISQGTQTSLIHVAGDVYAVAYSGIDSSTDGRDGWLKTVSMTTNNNEGMIRKEFSYGIGATTTRAFGRINGVDLLGTTTIDDGWHLVTMSYDKDLGSNQWKLYVDGVLDTQTASTSAIATNINPLLIGDDYEGRIDDVRIYNKALSASEVNDLYVQTKGTKVNAVAKGVGSAFSNGLVGHWTFDGPDMINNVADVSGNGNTGYLNGQTATTTVIGKVGQALEFDGVNDYVDTGITTTLTNFTVATWVKGIATPASGDSSGPVHKEKNFQVVWDHNNSTFRGAAALSVGGSWYAAKFSTLNADTWYYLVATYDGETLNAYTDGVLTTSNTSPSGDASAETKPLVLGKHAAVSNYWPGTIDDVRIYNRALSAGEVLKLYNAGR